MWNYLLCTAKPPSGNAITPSTIAAAEGAAMMKTWTIQCKKREKGPSSLTLDPLSLCSLLRNSITTHSTPRSYIIFTYPGFIVISEFPSLTGCGWLIWVREWSCDCEAPDIRQIRRLRSDVVYESTLLIRTRMRPERESPWDAVD